MVLFDLEIESEHSKDSQGRDLGHQFIHPIKDLQEDMHILKPTSYSVDRERTLKWKSFVEEVLGDILPVRMGLSSPAICLSQNLIHLMGMEAMIFSLVDFPVEFHQVMRRMVRDHINYMKWLENEGLLLLNNNNTVVAQGTFGFTRDLPGNNSADKECITTHDIWGYMDSQETVNISPEMFGEFFFPYYHEAAKQFGLLNYGCCEPVHPLWEKYLSTLPNLRKISVSPWCDEEYMGQVLKGRDVIFHRKPSPNYIGVGKELDEAAFREHILKTVDCAKGCKLEFSFI